MKRPFILFVAILLSYCEEYGIHHHQLSQTKDCLICLVNCNEYYHSFLILVFISFGFPAKISVDSFLFTACD